MIHIISDLRSPAGGTEWRAIKLFELLSKHMDAKIWTTMKPCKEFTEKFEINVIDEKSEFFPLGGTLIFVGVYWDIGDWIKNIVAKRVVIIYNTPSPKKLLINTLKLSSLSVPIEVVYASSYMQKSIGFPGIVQISPIDLDQYSYRGARKNDVDNFTVGRLSRDDKRKHFPKDINLYRNLSDLGFKLNLMGATILEPFLRDFNNINIYPECEIESHKFLHSLDCFYYRTNDSWFEPSGRVIAEAMSVGIPVVAHFNGGYIDWIDNGVNGFLFKTQKEAVTILNKLRYDFELRRYIGENARKKIENSFGKDAQNKIIEFYSDKYQNAQ